MVTRQKVLRRLGDNRVDGTKLPIKQCISGFLMRKLIGATELALDASAGHVV